MLEKIDVFVVVMLLFFLQTLSFFFFSPFQLEGTTAWAFTLTYRQLLVGFDHNNRTCSSNILLLFIIPATACKTLTPIATKPNAIQAKAGIFVFRLAPLSLI